MIALKKHRIGSESNPLSLTDRVYNRIFQAITTGEIPGETTLVAASVARQLGVSITPVRESLLRLATQGMVKPVPRVGYIVETLTPADVIDIFDARIGVERLLARMALEKITVAGVDFLERNLQEMNEELGEGHTERMLELDTAFHQFIAQVAGNKTLVSISQLLMQRMYRFRLACLRVLNLAQVTRNGHLEIVKAFRAGDQQALDVAVQNHLGSVKDAVVSYLQQLHQQSFGVASETLVGWGSMRSPVGQR